MKKRILSIVLLLVLCVGMLPTTVNAASAFTSSTTSAFYYYTLSNVGTGGYLTYGSSGFTVSKSCTKNSQNFAFMGNSSKKIMLCESDSVKYVGASSIKEGSKVTNSSTITYWVVQSVSGGVIIKPYANQNLALTASSSGVTLQKFSSKNKNQIWNLGYVKKISDSVTISSSLSSTSVEVGNTVSITGTVSSSVSILSSVKVYLLDSKGNVLTWQGVNPNSTKSYNLSSCTSTIKSKIKTLSTGTYTIKVVATNVNGKSSTSTKSITVKPLSSKTLINNTNMLYIKKTGLLSYSGPCFCYALAYCRDITDNKAYEWTQFRVNGTDCKAAYGDAGFKAVAANSSSEVYKAVYEQICEGKPVILCVKGGHSSGTHYIAIVGFTNVTSISDLSASNFLIIDSVGDSTPKVENMADAKYSLKNYTYYIYNK